MTSNWQLSTRCFIFLFAWGGGLATEPSISSASPEEFAHFDRTGPCAPFDQVVDRLREAQDQNLEDQQRDATDLTAQELGNFAQAMSKQFSKQCSYRGECARDMDFQNQQLQRGHEQRQALRQGNMDQIVTKLDWVKHEQQMCEDAVEHMLQRLDEARRR